MPNYFCEAYGLTKAEQTGLISLVIDRLQALVDFMRTEAEHGNEAFIANLADGHHRLYLKDIDYLKTDGSVFGSIADNLVVT